MLRMKKASGLCHFHGRVQIQICHIPLIQYLELKCVLHHFLHYIIEIPFDQYHKFEGFAPLEAWMVYHCVSFPHTKGKVSQGPKIHVYQSYLPNLGMPIH